MWRPARRDWGKPHPFGRNAPFQAGREPLYLGLMTAQTWRATKNALAGLITGLAGGVLLGVLIVVWGAAIFSLATA